MLFAKIAIKKDSDESVGNRKSLKISRCRFTFHEAFGFLLKKVLLNQEESLMQCK